MHIVNLTSFPALNALGSIKLTGHKNIAIHIGIHNKVVVSYLVASDTLYIVIKKF